MSKRKVNLDPAKIEYDGNSFTTVLTEEELQNKFNQLQKNITESIENELPCTVEEALSPNSSMRKAIAKIIENESCLCYFCENDENESFDEAVLDKSSPEFLRQT